MNVCVCVCVCVRYIPEIQRIDTKNAHTESRFDTFFLQEPIMFLQTPAVTFRVVNLQGETKGRFEETPNFLPKDPPMQGLEPVWRRGLYPQNSHWIEGAGFLGLELSSSLLGAGFKMF